MESELQSCTHVAATHAPKVELLSHIRCDNQPCSEKMHTGNSRSQVRVQVPQGYVVVVAAILIVGNNPQGICGAVHTRHLLGDHQRVGEQLVPGLAQDEVVVKDDPLVAVHKPQAHDGDRVLRITCSCPHPPNPKRSTSLSPACTMHRPSLQRLREHKHVPRLRTQMRMPFTHTTRATSWDQLFIHTHTCTCHHCTQRSMRPTALRWWPAHCT